MGRIILRLDRVMADRKMSLKLLMVFSFPGSGPRRINGYLKV